MDSGGGGTGGGARTETRPATAEEEAVKRNTDCVYFLASPLTCKKGNECEYRHSEPARLNPRDCYYWINSNCLNPKCAFRHPPLVPPSQVSGPSMLPTQTAAPKQIPMAHPPPYSYNKQSRTEPCIFHFQKGLCLKGEWCPFSHGPQSNGNTFSHGPKEAFPLQEQPQMITKELPGIKPCANQQITPKVSSDVTRAPVSVAKVAPRAENFPSNGVSRAKNSSGHPFGSNPPRPQAAQAFVTNSNAWSRAVNHQIIPSDEHRQDSAEPGEIVGDHSSGLANNVRPTPGGKKLDISSDYDHQSSDYKPARTYGRNQHGGSVEEYERNGRAWETYDMEPYRTPSERERDTPLAERRLMPRRTSPSEVNRVDLRHRLKQRKLDGSRYAVSPERREPHRRDDCYTEDRYQGHHPHRDQLQVPLESSISARLRGRISLPIVPQGPSFDSQSEREMPRLRSRLSPVRPIGNQGKKYDFNASSRIGGRLSRRDDVDTVNFSGPRSLRELKSLKLDEGSKASSYQEHENPPSFEGPKPLSVLLKRKREQQAPEANSGSGDDENNQREGSSDVYKEDASKEDDDHNVDDNFGTDKVETVEEDDSAPSGDHNLNDDEQSTLKEDMVEAEEYMETDAAEDQNYDQGEYDYEATEAGEEEDEFDEEDDFARKAGLLFS